MQIENLTGEFIVTLAGVVTSLFFAYFPGVSGWFDRLNPVYKPLWNLGVLFLVSVGVYLYSCRLDAVCLQANLERAIFAFIAALVTNQTTFQVAVKQLKRKTSMRQWHG